MRLEFDPEKVNPLPRTFVVRMSGGLVDDPLIHSLIRRKRLEDMPE